MASNASCSGRVGALQVQKYPSGWIEEKGLRPDYSISGKAVRIGAREQYGWTGNGGRQEDLQRWRTKDVA